MRGGSVPLLLLAALLPLWLSLSAAAASRAAPPTIKRVTLARLAGTWAGHTRRLVIRRHGAAEEHIDDGCCVRVLDMEIRLTHLRGTTRKGSAIFTITAIRYREKGTLLSLHVGASGTLQLRTGVLRESLTGTNYCNAYATPPGACGA